MQFNPCIDQCTKEGSHCQGCGRSHQEIANTKLLVKSVVDFAKHQEYDNIQEFIDYIGQKALRKSQKKS